MTWIDRAEQEPQPGVRILVWGLEWPKGVVAAQYDTTCGLGWVDVVDDVPLTFRHWMPAPTEPTA